MRAITKVGEPRSLTKHRESADDANYENYRHKDELRAALVREQRGICCYCMGAITDPGKAKIEHWRCQSGYENARLTYSNLLAACLGGEGRPLHLQHCDTRKGNRDLKFNPAEPAHPIEKIISYLHHDGSITSTDKEFDAQLNDVLGLNIAELKSQRREVIRFIMKWHTIYKSKHNRAAPRETLERKRRELMGEGMSALEPYSPVKVWWLDQRLARLSRPSR